jgi:hypothetical protein
MKHAYHEPAGGGLFSAYAPLGATREGQGRDYSGGQTGETVGFSGGGPCFLCAFSLSSESASAAKWL